MWSGDKEGSGSQRAGHVLVWRVGESGDCHVMGTTVPGWLRGEEPHELCAVRYGQIPFLHTQVLLFLRLIWSGDQ